MAKALRTRRLMFDDKQLKAVLKFLIKFNIFAIPLYVIILTGWNITWLQTATANLTYYLLSFLGFSPAVNGLLIWIPIKNGNWAAFINWDCTGWKSILAFFALVMSTDFPARKKLAGLLLIPLLYVINVLRILFMFFYVRTFDLQYYSQMHSIVWGWGLVAVVLVLWVFWMRHEDLLGKIFPQKNKYIGPKRK